MYEISSVIGGQLNSGVRANEGSRQNSTTTAVEMSFMSIAKSLAASQIAVTDRSQMAELGMRKQKEVEMRGGRPTDKEEDIFDMIAKVEKFIKEQQDR